MLTFSRYDMPEDKLETLFQSINGLLFTGGGLSLDADTQYFKTAQFLWNLAKAANDKGKLMKKFLSLLTFC